MKFPLTIPDTQVMMTPQRQSSSSYYLKKNINNSTTDKCAEMQNEIKKVEFFIDKALWLD